MYDVISVGEHSVAQSLQQGLTVFHLPVFFVELHGSQESLGEHLGGLGALFHLQGGSTDQLALVLDLHLLASLGQQRGHHSLQSLQGLEPQTRVQHPLAEGISDVGREGVSSLAGPLLGEHFSVPYDVHVVVPLPVETREVTLRGRLVVQTHCLEVQGGTLVHDIARDSQGHVTAAHGLPLVLRGGDHDNLLLPLGQHVLHHPGQFLLDTDHALEVTHGLVVQHRPLRQLLHTVQGQFHGVQDLGLGIARPHEDQGLFFRDSLVVSEGSPDVLDLLLGGLHVVLLGQEEGGGFGEPVESLVGPLAADEGGGELEVLPVDGFQGQGVQVVVHVLFETVLLVDHCLVQHETGRLHLLPVLVLCRDVLEQLLHEELVAQHQEGLRLGCPQFLEESVVLQLVSHLVLLVVQGGHQGVQGYFDVVTVEVLIRVEGLVHELGQVAVVLGQSFGDHLLSSETYEAHGFLAVCLEFPHDLSSLDVSRRTPCEDGQSPEALPR